jgi:hypothetical protein
MRRAVRRDYLLAVLAVFWAPGRSRYARADGKDLDPVRATLLTFVQVSASISAHRGGISAKAPPSPPHIEQLRHPAAVTAAHAASVRANDWGDHHPEMNRPECAPDSQAETHVCRLRFTGLKGENIADSMYITIKRRESTQQCWLGGGTGQYRILFLR